MDVPLAHRACWSTRFFLDQKGEPDRLFAPFLFFPPSCTRSAWLWFLCRAEPPPASFAASRPQSWKRSRDVHSPNEMRSSAERFAAALSQRRFGERRRSRRSP